MHGQPAARATSATRTPCGVPKTASKHSADVVRGVIEKMPPPSLLITTRVRSGRSGAAPVSRPFWSCSRDRSPSSATARPALCSWWACAAPTALETAPSMPLRPRLASTRRSDRGRMVRSTSRTGMLDPANSSEPEGSAAVRSRARRASVRPPSSRVRSRVSSAALSACCHSRSQSGSLSGCSGAPSRDTTAVAVRAGSAQSFPGSTTTSRGAEPRKLRRARFTPGLPTLTTNSGAARARKPGWASR